jgi:hypothetical protein
MKYIFFFLFSILMGIPADVLAKDGSSDWLSKLDKSLAQREQYERQHVERIDSLKKDLAQIEKLPNKKADDRYYDLMYQLYNEYKSYCYDSAHHYADECLAVAKFNQQEDRIFQASNAVSFTLISAGFLTEANEVLRSIDRSKLSGRLLEDYYEHNSQLWRAQADYVREEPFYTKYITQSNAYLDSLKQLLPPNSARWWSCMGSRQMREHQFQQALESFNKVLSHSDSDLHMKAMTTAEMAWAYIYLDNEDKAIDYFAQSAIYDNETATREITALYHLSRLIYKKGDHERASVYVHQALDDVQFYNSRLRKIEIGDILPIIERDRYEAVSSQRNWLIAASCLFVLLSAVILCSYWFIRKKNHTLTAARETIASQLHQLQVANRQLKEDDKIKNAYIGRSFYTNSEFIAKLEKLYLTIDRKIVARQYDDLRAMMKLSTLNAERENMYEAFDQTFLKIFPDFVQKYNLLFEEKDRKLPPNDHSLTSEMRIFALIRLGITDSERIAKFLNYSVHTVNTYKTRIKNRSTVENEQFENCIMEI